jgi:hypothetical protein
MKNLIFFLCISMLCSPISAQMHDNIWLFGYTNGTTDPEWGVYSFKHTDGLTKWKKEVSTSLQTNSYSSFFSDSLGQRLLFWTNGLNIYNGQYKIMENGGAINNNADWYAGAYDVNGQLCGAIPDPQNPNCAYLIHCGMEPEAPFDQRLLIRRLFYSKIDLKANNGLGKVIEKNVILASGDFTKPAIVKHGDGKSYWVVIGQRSEPGFVAFHFDTSGIRGPMFQDFAGYSFEVPTGFDRLIFTPDGKQLVRVGTHGGIIRYDFDRCTGKFSNTRISAYTNTEAVLDGSISHDSKYLFFNTYTTLVRCDLNVVSLPMSRGLDTIARFNYNNDYNGAIYRWFFQHSLSPNGNIFMAPGSSVFAYHIIHEPETPIVSHDFEQEAVRLPVLNAGALPMFINYRLGPKVGSPCAPMLSALPLFQPGFPLVLPIVHSGVFKAPPEGRKVVHIKPSDIPSLSPIPDPNIFYIYENE